MNTADIRDMNRGQGLYWAIAIPVTFSVLLLAFLYGYKGDSTAEKLQRRLESYYKSHDLASIDKLQITDVPGVLPSTTMYSARQDGDAQGSPRQSQWFWRQDAVDHVQKRQKVKRRVTTRTIGD